MPPRGAFKPYDGRARTVKAGTCVSRWPRQLNAYPPQFGYTGQGNQECRLIRGHVATNDFSWMLARGSRMGDFTGVLESDGSRPQPRA